MKIKIEYLVKKFNELTVYELFEIYKLRSKIFVVEQNCIYQDIDNKDLIASHVLILFEKKIIAYSRLLPKSKSYSFPSIGRVIVDVPFRGKKIGKLLMKFSLKKIIEIYKEKEIIISAQNYLFKFYSELGFKKEGAEYLEDNIPHIKMRYILSK